ncbi:TetR/AcrR family transcriptional regulator [Spongorhabdus nitratireducens]
MPSSRTVTRADGKASKQAILDATLQIMLKAGMRQVKYKTIAEVAGVTPSAAAYYFKDIDNLIRETFDYYLDAYQKEMSAVRNVGLFIVSPYNSSELLQAEVRIRVVEEYAGAIRSMLCSGDPDARDFILLDRIFRNETLQNARLKKALMAQDEKDLGAMREFLEQLQTSDPETDAVQLMALLWFIAERVLLANYSEASVLHAEAMLKKVLRRLILQQPGS